MSESTSVCLASAASGALARGHERVSTPDRAHTARPRGCARGEGTHVGDGCLLANLAGAPAAGVPARGARPSQHSSPLARTDSSPYDQVAAVPKARILTWCRAGRCRSALLRELGRELQPAARTSAIRLGGPRARCAPHVARACNASTGRKWPGR